MDINAGFLIEDSASHAIEVHEFSTVEFGGVVSGTGNAGAGLYAHNGANVKIKNAAAPTVTGTVGHISVDGTTEASTWTTVDAGTPFADNDYLVRVDESS